MLRDNPGFRTIQERFEEGTLTPEQLNLLRTTGILQYFGAIEEDGEYGPHNRTDVEQLRKLVGKEDHKAMSGKNTRQREIDLQIMTLLASDPRYSCLEELFASELEGVMSSMHDVQEPINLPVPTGTRHSPHQIQKALLDHKADFENQLREILSCFGDLMSIETLREQIDESRRKVSAESAHIREITLKALKKLRS